MKTLHRKGLQVLLSACLVIAMLAGFNSCKEDRGDMTGLLSTVPSSAAGVIGLDLKSILTDMGCKVEGNEIKPGKDLQSVLNNMKDDNKTQFLKLFDGTSGVSPECAVIFYDANRMFITLSLYDVDSFYKSVESSKGMTFSDEGNGVKVCGNTAVKGAQAWVCLSSGKRIDVDAIAAYSKLKSSQSFLSTDMAEKFVDGNNDIVGWGQIQALLSGTMSRGNMQILNMVTGFLFDDASDLSFTINFEKGKFTCKALILNEDGKPAKYLLTSDKIDTKVIESLGETCDGLLAFTVTPKMIKKFEKVASAFGGTLGNIGETLKNVDGTVAVVSSSPDNDGFQSLNGVITTKGDVSMELKDLVSSGIAPIREDGKYLRFSKGVVSGSLNVADCANMIKGSCLGAVIDLRGMEIAGNYIPKDASEVSFHSMALTLMPEGGGLELKLVINGINSKENILLTILKAINKG